MTTVANASVVFKDKNGNVGTVKGASANDITKISNAISDVAQVVNPTTHLPINATTSSVGVVQLADSAAVAAGTSGRVVDAAQLKDAIEHVTPAGNLMTLDTAQTVTAVKTFSSLPESSVAPTTDNQLANKKYVDDHVPVITNMVTTDTAQSISGVKTFSALPESSVVPTTDDQLVNKKYVDDNATSTADCVKLTGNQTVAGVKTFTSLPQSSATPSANADLVNKSYVDNGFVDLSTDQAVDGVKTFSDIPVVETVPTALNQLANKNYVDGYVTRISNFFNPVYYRRPADFKIVGRTTIRLPAYLSLMVNGHGYSNTADVDIDITQADNWDDSSYAAAVNRAGVDFYIYAVDDDTVDVGIHIVLSANSTVPDGYTASTSRKIGGFHCLCASVGTPTYLDPATKTNKAHWLSGYVTGDILPYSVWDLRHRAQSENEGMVFDPENKIWWDIYLASWSGSELVSEYGGTTADGASTKPFHGEMFAECAAQVNKQLVPRDAFIAAAKGSNEKTSIAGSADAGTTGGHVDTANRRMISNIGLEDCCGFLWQWCKQDGGANGSGGWGNSVSAAPVDTAAGVYGQAYGSYYRAFVGGGWDHSSYCGSRCVHVDAVSARVYAGDGGRLFAPERVVNGL